MKKFIYLVLVIIIFSACSKEDNQSEQDTITDETTNEIVDGSINSDVEQESTQDKVENDESDNQNNEDDNVALEEEVVEVEPQYELIDDWSLKPISENANEKVVLLTIDDVPDTYAIDMAKTLKSLDASAIFFVNGHFLATDEQKEMLKQIHDMGFPIGNHTYNHQKLDDVSQEVQKEEILSLNNKIEEIIGEKPRFFRAPHGVNTDYSKQLVEEEGMLLMNWTYGYDYFEPYMDAEKLTTAMVSGEGPEVGVSYSLLKPGANLLMHDREWTNTALENIVLGLREQGYEILDPSLIKLPEL